MKFFCVEQIHNGVVYKLSPFSGNLRYFPVAKPRVHSLPAKVYKILAQCSDPYKLESDIIPQTLFIPPRDSRQAKVILKRMLMLPSASFYLAWRYSGMKVPLFPDSGSSINWFNAHTLESDRDSLCLPRSLFAAKTSMAFQALGAIVIGSMIPTNSLHAWVFENDKQPDDLDRNWVCYQPIAVLM